jgi:hypothetical protein
MQKFGNISKRSGMIGSSNARDQVMRPMWAGVDMLIHASRSPQKHRDRPGASFVGTRGDDLLKSRNLLFRLIDLLFQFSCRVVREREQFVE